MNSPVAIQRSHAAVLRGSCGDHEFAAVAAVRKNTNPATVWTAPVIVRDSLGFGVAAMTTIAAHALANNQDVCCQAIAPSASASARNATVAGTSVRPSAYRLIPRSAGEISGRAMCSADTIATNVKAASLASRRRF